MRLTILYDNETLRGDLAADWGFACLVENEQRRILFDTGAHGSILIKNMELLEIDPHSIDDVVISHAHWDHVGGLPDFLSRNADVRLFVPPSFDAPSRAAREIFPVADPMEIDRGIYLTGELAGIEQALLVKTGKGLVTIVGCSHPGIGMILEKAEGFGKTKSLIGGFHGFNQFDLLEDIDLVCPTHCTQYKEEIAVRYPKAFIEGGVSRVIEIS